MIISTVLRAYFVATFWKSCLVFRAIFCGINGAFFGVFNSTNRKDKRKSTPEVALNLCKPTRVKVVGASETTEHSSEFSVLRMGR